MESISHFEQNLGLRDEGDFNSVYYMGKYHDPPMVGLGEESKVMTTIRFCGLP
jgi:hypothetical protein